MWVPGKTRRRQQREQKARAGQMRADYIARRQIEEELAAANDPAPRKASTVRRLVFRGRKVLIPFLLLVVLGGAGWLSWARTMAPLAMPVLWLIVSALWWASRGRLALDRAAERRYAGVCIAAGAVWLLLAGFGVGLFWLAAGWTALSLPWWQHHWPRDTPPAEPESEVEEEPETVMTLWEKNVAASGRALPGSSLSAPELTEHGEAYRVQLVPGAPSQKMSSVIEKIPEVASGLRKSMTRIVLEQHPDTEDPSIARLQVIHRSPIMKPVYFQAPRWERGTALLGPHGDGIGHAGWRVYTNGSMWGGFVVGGTGSGKTRFLDMLTLTMMAMSVEFPTAVLYLDGQDGASSSTLWNRALWRGGPREANSMLCALERGLGIRQKYNRINGLSGFTPSLVLPGVAVIVDECHRIFNQQNALRWANVAREARKVGMGIIAADQINDLSVFGGQEALRSSLFSGNGVLMRTLSRQTGNLMPGMTLDPSTFPDLPGFGYKMAAPGSGERTAPFRAEFLPDAEDAARIPDLQVPTVEQWFERIRGAELDEMTARAFGEDFLNRHALAELAEQAARDEIEGLAPATPIVAPAEQLAAATQDDGTTYGQVLALCLARPYRPVELERETGKSKSGVKQALNRGLTEGMLFRNPSGTYEAVREAIPAS